MIGDPNDEDNFTHKLLLTNTQVSNICKALLTNYQLILTYQKLSYLIWYNQANFLIDVLLHY